MRTDERRKSGTGAARTLAALVALASLASCSGGGGGSSGGTTTVVLGDASFVAALTDEFTFAIDGVTVITEDGGRVRVFGGERPPRTFDLSFVGDEFRPKVVAAGGIAPGVYTGLEVCYRNPLVGSGDDSRPATPASGCFTVTFPEPIEVTDGSGHAIHVDFDLAASIASTGGSSFTFDPRAIGHSFEAGEDTAVEAFRARIRHWSDDHDWAACTLYHPDGFGGWTESGDLTVRFGAATVLAFEDGSPIRFENYFPSSALDAYVGRDFFFTGHVLHDGSFSAESAELDATGHESFDNVAFEALVAGGDEDGENYVLFVTRVLDDDGNVVPLGERVIRATFGSDETPVYLQSTGETASRDMLLQGTRTWFTGHFPPPPLRRSTDGPAEIDGDGFGGDSLDMTTGWRHLRRRTHHRVQSHQGEAAEGLAFDPIGFDRFSRPDFVVSTARLTDQQVRGVVQEIDAREGVVFAELTGLQGFDLDGDSSPRFAFRVYPDTEITVDGLHPIGLDGLLDDDQFELMGVPIPGAYGGPATASLVDGDDARPTTPGDHFDPVFVCRELRVRGREFGGEVVTGIDPSAYAFDLTGDGADFGLPDPATFRIVVPAYVFAQAESGTGLETGLGRDAFFQRLPFAAGVRCRGYYDPNAAVPTLVATWLEVETP